MNIDPRKTLKMVEQCLPKDRASSLSELKRACRHTLHLYSQLLSAIYDAETFKCAAPDKSYAQEQVAGKNCGVSVVLKINEPLPSMKKLTEAIEEHWKAMIHSAIAETAQQGPLPHFRKAFVEIEIVTTRGSNNAQLWDTSNRAINVIINNLKGIFFEDDNMEHMAFSVIGRWGKEGSTTIRISELETVPNRYFKPTEQQIHEQ